MENKVAMILAEIKKRLEERHIGCFKGMKKPLLLISEQYPGLWLEHLYDSVFYAQMDRTKLYLAENAVNLFIDNQKEDGQLPCYVLDGAKSSAKSLIGYCQIQECVSFASLAYMVYEMNGDTVFLKKVYEASKKWVSWLKNNRMTLKQGLVEMFFGFDTGHDNSGRLDGISCKGNYRVNGAALNAAALPPEDNITPMLAVDMNCNFYGNLKALSKMAAALGVSGEEYELQAAQVKKRLFEVCFDREDCFFYDADRYLNKRKILSSTVFHLFMEGVLDPKEDAALTAEVFKRYVLNEKHFNTPYPYPAVSISDPTWKKHTDFNCWGYFTQGLIALRCTLWLDKYGHATQMDNLCKAWVRAWTDCFDYFKLGQELDPITGIPSQSSQWYSSCMLMYMYAARRIKCRDT